MRPAFFSQIGMDSSVRAFSCERSERRGLFTLVLDALHHSRRQQANQILWQYRHLIADADQCAAFNRSLNRKDRNDVGR